MLCPGDGKGGNSLFTSNLQLSPLFFGSVVLQWLGKLPEASFVPFRVRNQALQLLPSKMALTCLQDCKRSDRKSDHKTACVWSQYSTSFSALPELEMIVTQKLHQYFLVFVLHVRPAFFRPPDAFQSPRLLFTINLNWVNSVHKFSRRNMVRRVESEEIILDKSRNKARIFNA